MQFNKLFKERETPEGAPVWRSKRDGSIHDTKAAVIAHNASLDRQKASSAATVPRPLPPLPAARARALGKVMAVNPDLTGLARIDRLASQVATMRGDIAQLQKSGAEEQAAYERRAKVIAELKGESAP